MGDSFGSRGTLRIDDQDFTLYRLAAVARAHPGAARLPYALRILLENLLRHEDGQSVQAEDVVALANFNPKAEPSREIAFTPARVLLQDFTGVPAVVDLAAMRDAMKRMGGDPTRINPLQPVELVIDHSVQVDSFGTQLSLRFNSELEFARNRERYVFLRWGQKAFRNFRVVPPETGIVHQVNLEYLARVVFTDDTARPLPLLYPDTLVGTDSHTTMINGLGVLGWGVGGIEAEAAMLGQPVSMLIPQVVGFKLTGELREGATATDLVLVVTEMLRKKGVVGKFVEFYGAGLAALPLADRATIANMAPEYGATCGIFPLDAETLRYLRLTGRTESQIHRVEAYAKEQGLFHTADTPEAVYSDTLSLDLGTVEPSLAGPSRPQDRVPLRQVKQSFGEALQGLLARTPKKPGKTLPLASPDTGAVTRHGGSLSGTDGSSDPTLSSLEAAASRPTAEVGADAVAQLKHGSVVIAAITSCTNTSNPSVMLAAGLVAKKAVEHGLSTQKWVKTSLAPGSKVVTEYLRKAGLMEYLDHLRFNLVGYGCTTCVAAGTPVLRADGTACPIERMPEAGAVLFGPNVDRELALAVQTEIMARGERDCVSLTLQDGRTLVCTPDHEILCDDGRWVRADRLEPGRDRVVVGLEAPVDEPGPDEADWVLSAGEWTFTLDTPANRLKALAFARLLGHLLGDGSISAAGQGHMHLGQAVDREVVLNDVELLTGKRPLATRYDERKWTVVLPARLTEAVVALAGVRVGRRIDQAPRLPEFLLDARCPVAVLREYLGGAFGADGKAPTLYRTGMQEEDATLLLPTYWQSAGPENVGQFKQVLNQLLGLLARCGVKTDGARVIEYPVRHAVSSLRPGQGDVSRFDVYLQLPDGLSFVERVGFRYCVDKSLRASAAVVYWRAVDRIHRQRLHRDRCSMPSPVELFKKFGLWDRFAPLLARTEVGHPGENGKEKTALALPTFALQVIDRRPAGVRPVFDLAVEGVHAFVAGTVCVHNCIGNSGPLPTSVSKVIEDRNLVVAAVLSGNRNFEGRVHSEVRANYLASPPLVVAYALAGRMDIDLQKEPLGHDAEGNAVYLRDIWPTQEEIRDAVKRCVEADMFEKVYREAFSGDERWTGLEVPEGDLYRWQGDSTYVKNPPYFEDMGREPGAVTDVRGARVLAVLGDSITTDHISPAGSIKADSPAGKYLLAHGVEVKDFNSYGSRRGNHEVMMRGTFANVRLRNKLAPGTEGGFTRHLPDGQPMTIFDAAVKYRAEGVPLVILAGKEYGSGSSRDWAAKGPRLLGVRVVIAETYERIHRSNLVGMGVLPLQFRPGESAATLGLTGEEVYDVTGLAETLARGLADGREVAVRVWGSDGSERSFRATVRIDTPQEVEYYRHGGILPYVLRQLLATK
jgi:aconitase A